MEGDPSFSQDDTWGVTETFLTWQGRSLFRIEANRGVVDSSIIELLWQVGHCVDREGYSGRALLERRVRYEHVE